MWVYASQCQLVSLKSYTHIHHNNVLSLNVIDIINVFKYVQCNAEQ